ncbi:MAG: Na(+)/H(+) antiporter subunit B [Proteobacteria bacterium]|nr:Na(+)/H(+) antiporter subunit B [Pseudomonadota bacterium]
MKKLAFVTILLLGIVLMAITADFPRWGDPLSPASTYLSPHFIEKTMEETSVPNIVTAVLGDYRGYDTMFETTVVFCAGAACFFILGSFGREEDDKIRYFRHRDTGVVLKVQPHGTRPSSRADFERIDPTWTPYDFIISRVAGLMIPFIQLFGLYVVAHGHHSPGGGFQGGVILAASFLLLALSHNMRTLSARISNKVLGLMSASGVLIYAGWGALALAFGGNFLDYSVLGVLLGLDPIAARSMGIMIVEIGVALTVMSTMIIIYNNVASLGAYDEGL